jgi:hypothetical protein
MAERAAISKGFDVLAEVRLRRGMPGRLAGGVVLNVVLDRRKGSGV